MGRSRHEHRKIRSFALYTGAGRDDLQGEVTMVVDVDSVVSMIRDRLRDERHFRFHLRPGETVIEDVATRLKQDDAYFMSKLISLWSD